MDEESPDEEYYGPEEKKELKRFTLEQPYTQEKIIQLIELFRKYRVSIRFQKIIYVTKSENCLVVLRMSSYIYNDIPVVSKIMVQMENKLMVSPFIFLQLMLILPKSTLIQLWKKSYAFFL